MDRADPIDIAVGQRIRARRSALGMTSDDLATAVGISAALLSKYERGQNRVSARRLVAVSAALQVRPEYFFMLDDAMLEVVVQGGPAEAPETLARCASLEIGKAAFQQAVKEHPGRRVLLWDGAEVVDEAKADA